LATEEKDNFSNLVNAKIDEITQLKSKAADTEGKLASATERIEGQVRDIKFKADAIREFEQRLTKTNDELDLAKYKVQE
jgi:predicted  nucleic acid-binding Zn-ribbon protein